MVRASGGRDIPATNPPVVPACASVRVPGGENIANAMAAAAAPATATAETTRAVLPLGIFVAFLLPEFLLPWPLLPLPSVYI